MSAFLFKGIGDGYIEKALLFGERQNEESGQKQESVEEDHEGDVYAGSRRLDQQKVLDPVQQGGEEPRQRGSPGCLAPAQKEGQGGGQSQEDIGDAAGDQKRGVGLQVDGIDQYGVGEGLLHAQYAKPGNKQAGEDEQVEGKGTLGFFIRLG